MKTIGWYHANLLQTYVGSCRKKTGITEDLFQAFMHFFQLKCCITTIKRLYLVLITGLLGIRVAFTVLALLFK